MSTASQERLTHSALLQLKRWNTPTVYNGWEQITGKDPGRDGFNLESLTDFMPEQGVMAGFALTVVCQPGNREHARHGPRLWREYLAYAASVPGPRIVVVQDLDKPHTFGSFWGEVNANIHRTLGCAGTIVDGAIRDLEEMRGAGFKALARRLCVGHAYSCPVRWGCEVEVFGRKIQPGQFIHADQHGFLAVPPEDEGSLLDAARAMDRHECEHLIPAAREAAGLAPGAAVAQINSAFDAFREAVQAQFKRRSEW